ncbi:MAG: hypothetical protein U9P49_12380 [Thermodesulfobacteriota bacterium]|nr:hypothetical protein [Thermodesulfobacteriota bacterium]
MYEQYPNIFQSYTIGDISIRNRLVAQAMETNSAIDGKISPEIIERYQRLAQGQWGVVFVESISITEKNLARKNGLVINRRNLDSFKKLVEAFKRKNSDALLLFQLNHSGRASGDFSERVKVYNDEDSKARLLSESELDEIGDQFIDAAVLSRQAGADGVDIKACHGYLGAELLRPLNNRADKYGGSIENRARLISAAVHTIKKEIPCFIVGTRVSIYEGIRGGCGTASPAEVIEELDDILEILSCIVNAGADYINISAGIPTITPHITRPVSANNFDMFRHFRYTKIVKERFPNIAIIGSAYSSGKENGVKWAQENIEKGYTDFAGFGRQNLADALFPRKLKESPGDINYCTLCGGCSGLLKKQKEVYCTMYGGEHKKGNCKLSE